MYLYLAMFWLVTGVLVQIFWSELAPLAQFPINRNMMGAVFFVLFSYNFIRWRLARAMQQARREAEACLNATLNGIASSEASIDSRIIGVSPRRPRGRTRSPCGMRARRS